MDLDNVKAFAIAHLEKFVFGVFVLIAGLLIYSGLQKEDFMAAQRTDPDALSQMATQVKTQIDDDHTEAILSERRREDLNIVARTKLRDTPVIKTPYEPEKYWRDLDPGSVIRRTDPVLASAIDLKVHGVVASIAQTSLKQSDYPLEELEGADPVEKEVERKRPDRNRRRQQQMMMMDGGMDDGMDPSMMGMDPSMMGMDPTMMGGNTTMGPNRKLSGNDDLSGYRPMPAAPLYPQPRVWTFIAGVALLPYKEVYNAYETALADADGYNIGRDVPIYHDLQIQRADVTGRSVDDLVEEDWVLRFDRKTHYKLAKRDWIGVAPEIVPADYREDALTLHIPPILMDEYYDYTTHSRLPKLSKQDLKMREAQASNVEEIQDLEEDLESDNEVLVGPGMTATMGGGFDSGMMDFDYGGASFQGGMSIGRGQIEIDPVDHKLIRFFDFAGIIARTAPKPGRKYVYRVRYGVVDPNFPQIKEMQPATSTLDPATAARVTGLVLKAEQNNKRDGLWIRYSEWSEPTAPISLPDWSDQFAGPVTKGRMSKFNVGNRQLVVPRDPPTVEVVTSQFSARYGTRIPLRTKIQPGMTLSAKAEHADVVDPITLSIKKVPGEEARVNNLTTLIDVSGAGASAIDEDLSLPAQLLLMRPDGSLSVSDNVDDQRKYRIHSYAEERGK